MWRSLASPSGNWFARFLDLPQRHSLARHVWPRVRAAQHPGVSALLAELAALAASVAEEPRRGNRRQGAAGHLRLSLWEIGIARDQRLGERTAPVADQLGQVAVDGKSNEITAVPQLLELLELAGAVATMDAMHYQKDTIAAIRAKRADYLIAVKDNQPKLHTLLQELFIGYGERDYKVPGLRCFKTVERNRGRNETRVYYAIVALPELRNHLQ